MMFIWAEICADNTSMGISRQQAMGWWYYLSKNIGPAVAGLPDLHHRPKSPLLAYLYHYFVTPDRSHNLNLIMVPYYIHL